MKNELYIETKEFQQLVQIKIENELLAYGNIEEEITWEIDVNNEECILQGVCNITHQCNGVTYTHYLTALLFEKEGEFDIKLINSSGMLYEL